MTWDRRLLLLVTCVVLLGQSDALSPSVAEDAREIWVNGLRLDAEQVLLLEDVVGVRLRSGAYLYDPVNGSLRAVGMSATPNPPPAWADG